MEDEGPQIRVKFITDNVNIRVTETPFAVPVHLNRRGLSQVVNHLLNTNVPRPFDFFVDGTIFLHSSLEKHMQKYLVSEEAVLILKYMDALPEPTSGSNANHPDWVSAVAVTKEFIVTGCYDGILRIFQFNGTFITSVKAHAGAIKSLSCHVSSNDGVYYIISTGKDQAGQVHAYYCNTKKLEGIAVLNGHLDSIDTVDSTSTMILSGSWDNTVRTWDIPAIGNHIDDSQPKKKQRQKANGHSAVSFQQMTAKSVLTGHTSNVKAVEIHPIDSNQCISGSIDRTMKLWDLEIQSAVQTVGGTRAISDLSINPSNGLVLSAHPDHTIRLWDFRAAEAAGVSTTASKTFQSHKSWVTSVAWTPKGVVGQIANSTEKRLRDSEFLFASSSYDGTVKLWDTRSTIPLHTVTAHDGKVLAFQWNMEMGDNEKWSFVSGGDDRQMKLFTM